VQSDSGDVVAGVKRARPARGEMQLRVFSGSGVVWGGLRVNRVLLSELMLDRQNRRSTHSRRAASRSRHGSREEN
jgi:hypothetical protein